MSWDLGLNDRRDLTGGYVTAKDEVLQRLVTRLMRELGEWFLDRTAGLPWYQGGHGMLGSKDRDALDIQIRAETLGTDGVLRILSYQSSFNTVTRNYSISMMLLLREFGAVNFTLADGVFSWQTTTSTA